MDQEQDKLRQIYTPFHVLIATALGGPVAGTILLALNYKTMGDIKAAKQWLAGSVVFILIFFTYVFSGFELPFLKWTPLMFTIIMYYIAKTVVPSGLLSKGYGYIKASSLVAAGLGLGILVFFLGVAFLGGLFIELMQSS